MLIVSGENAFKEIMELSIPDEQDDGLICPICDRGIYLVTNRLVCGACGLLYVDTDGMLGEA